MKTREEMNAYLEAKALEYTRKHEFALSALFTDLRTALDTDADMAAALDTLK